MTLKSPVSYKLTLAMGICHLPLLIPRLNQVLLQLLTFQHPLKGVQGGEQKWGTLCSGKNWQDRSSDSLIFSGADFISPTLVSSYLEKHWNPSQWICSLWLAVPFCKKYVLDHIHSSFTKITYILTFLPASLEQFLRVVWDAISHYSPHLPQVKLDSQLSHCVYKSTVSTL